MKKLLVTFATLSLLMPIFSAAQTTDTGGAAGDTSVTATPASLTTGANSVTAAATTASTPSGSAYQFKRDGVFDCSAGQYAQTSSSIGSSAALAGAYVPVDSSTLDVNTYTIVYKECVLREVVDRERESALSTLFKQATVAVQTGRNGNPQYVVNQGLELVTGVDDPTFLAFEQDTSLWNNVNTALQGPIQRALAQYYEGERTGDQATSLKCPYQGSLQAYQSGQPLSSANFFVDFLNASAPQCDPITEAFFAQDIVNGRIARATQYQQDQWNWGRGYYARVDASGNIITPSSVVEQSYEQLLQSPVQQLQSANDIGQMIGALYAGVTTQVIGDQNGLAGISQSVGSQPSYLNQVVAESAAGLQGAATNAALQILGASQTVESNYYQAANAIGANLLQRASAGRQSFQKYAQHH